MMPLVLMIAVTNLLDAAVGAVLLPVWIKDHGFGPGHTSLILTSFGVTATLFALLASAVGERIPRKLVFTLAFLICGAPRFVVMAFDAPVWALMAVYAVGGIGAGFINPVLGALFIERIPRHDARPGQLTGRRGLLDRCATRRHRGRRCDRRYRSGARTARGRRGLPRRDHVTGADRPPRELEGYTGSDGS